MRHSFATAAALAGALVLGCSDGAAPTGPASVAAPVDPGLPSLRAEHITFPNAVYLGGLPDNPLVIGAGFKAGVTPASICAGATDIYEGGEGQFVFTSPGGLHGHFSGHDVLIDVFAFAGPTEPCAMAGAPVVATGTGKFTLNFELGGGPFVVHATVQGIVDLVSGGQAKVLGTARVNFLPDGTVQFDEERVTLKPH